MIVAPQFQGDDMALAEMQHDVYADALSIIVRRCKRFARMAIAILGGDSKHPQWDDAPRFDHRTLQFAHDLLAAAWRYETNPPQSSLPLPQDRPKREYEADTPDGRWLQWLDAEVASWLHVEAGPWDEGQQKIRFVLEILANQGKPAGDEAGAGLAQLIYRRFRHVPWDKVLYPE